jgi:hypothetical protein
VHASSGSAPRIREEPIGDLDGERHIAGSERRNQDRRFVLNSSTLRSRHFVSADDG